ncbi:MAG: DUF4440 domain-containing protein [Sphingomicrobium sp.]
MTLAFSLTTTACHRDHDEGEEHGEHAAKPISEAEAKAATDATVATWASMDAKKIDALYAPDVVGFDISAPGLSTDRANWTKNQQSFADGKFDKVVVRESKTQVLDGDDFIFSSTSDGTSSAGPIKVATFRCTDVFRKQADGKFLIVNEHCSGVPKSA